MQPTPGQPPQAVAAAGAPIVIGQAGTFSGPIGAIFKGSVTALQVWAKTVNSRGGIGGRPVTVITMDDGGDPARSAANVKELVERRGVIALVSDFSLLTRGAHSQYLLDHNIPVVGGEGGTLEWLRNRVYFLNVPYGDVQTYGAVSDAKLAGKRKLSVLYCAETQACREAVDWAKSAAQELGLDVVYSAQISVAQPDYTAECLQSARNGADAVWFMADAASIARGANSCARQNYKPLYLSVNGMQTDQLATTPAFRVPGATMIGNQPVFPWFLKEGSPSIVEFRDSFARYASSASVDGASAIGWASAKLFERALAGHRGEVTSAAVFKGLWSLKNETLGGLTAPLTFAENQPSKNINCWFSTAIVDGKWASPQGGKPTCAPRSF